MNAPLLPLGLTVPEALIVLMHDTKGYVVQNVPPQGLVATAELIEACIQGQLRLADEKVFAAASPSDSQRSWVDDLRQGAPVDGVPVAEWIRANGAALDRQRELAAQAGVVRAEGHKLFGLMKYERYVPQDAARETVVDAMRNAPQTDVRATELARLVIRGNLLPAIGADEQTSAAIEQLAQRGQGPGAPGRSLDGTDVATAAILYGTIAGS